METLTEQELHYLVMNIAGKELQKAGFEFLSVNSKLKKDPQFVCLKEKKLHFVVVKAVSHPNDPTQYDTIYMETIKEHALKFNARAYYVGVGISNAEDPLKPVYKNEKYVVRYSGLIEI
ncbi:Na(+)-translocating NADH-quinone reductase subunit F [Leptobacterium flavescens]|uniref:Na(+)-translocating NADH-quinone reductase subunit F n=1 Tax=Leptobacterium flavescens TaxID=472055 RepID=A0A6P0UHE6_9FLAO|nr:Na(+)-translocating NADH-quinone reductase subunit F [Leptobacterium flavescens]NER12427.1 Na(+)-translocating NADH-quinone reductase subunit F [Leptobacterium flavescens]